MKNTKTKINGLDVENITYKSPGNNLPKFVLEAAETRGYGDSTQTLSMFIQDTDINEAFSCAAQGNGSSCVMAQAGMRIGAKAVYFYRTTAWIDFGHGPIVRFQTSKSIYDNVIAPFDKGDRSAVLPGIYHLTPFVPSKTLSSMRSRPKAKKPLVSRPDGSMTPIIQVHMERVVMASRVA